MSAVSGTVMVMDMVGRAARRRETALADLDETERAARGQFFTPTAVAKIMARLLKVPDHGVVRVLDPGAGSGLSLIHISEPTRH